MEVRGEAPSYERGQLIESCFRFSLKQLAELEISGSPYSIHVRGMSNSYFQLVTEGLQGHYLEFQKGLYVFSVWIFTQDKI